MFADAKVAVRNYTSYSVGAIVDVRIYPSDFGLYTEPNPRDARIHQFPHLVHLMLDDGWRQHLSLTHLSHDLGVSNIKKLRITAVCDDVFRRCITPAFTSVLTYPSLGIVSTASISPYRVILEHGANLQYLHVDGPLYITSSQHFRRYAHALPCLTEFGINHFGLVPDPDFFPAVCDFLRPKAPQLVRLELKTICNKPRFDQLGFNGENGCWSMLRCTTSSTAAVASAVSFPELKHLSITLPPGRKNISLHYANLIPNGVTSLVLSGNNLNAKSAMKVVSFYSSKPCLPHIT